MEKNNKHKVLFSILMDISGSMNGHIDYLWNAYINFNNDQKKNSTNDSKIIITPFNTKTCERIIKTIDGDLNINFITGDCTALYDSYVETIQYISEISNDFNKVYFIVITDGEDNSSGTFKKNDCKTFTNQYPNWDFVYFGANQNAVVIGGDLGIPEESCLTFSQDVDHTNSAFMSLSSAIDRSISSDSGVGVHFSQEERFSSSQMY
jgi:hypothetical protein